MMFPVEMSSDSCTWPLWGSGLCRSISTLVVCVCY